MTPDVQEHSFEECEAMGTALAQAGLTVLARCPTVPVEVLAVRQQRIATRLTNILYEEAFRRRLLPDVRDAEGRIHSEVSVIKIGTAWFAAVPGELLPGLGLALKASLKEAGAETAGIIGLANHELGYILPAEDFRYPRNPLRPGKHYEETNSIGKEIGPAVMAAVRSLL